MKYCLFLNCLVILVTIAADAQPPTVAAKKITTTININGNPGETEWEFTNSITKKIIGTPNNVASYAVLWDNSSLYIAVNITDNKTFYDSPNSWDDDAIEIFIDAENDKGTSYGVNDRRFIKAWKSTGIWERNNNIANVQHAWSTIKKGFSMEIKIPWSSIGIANPVAGLSIGFDIANDDDDNGGSFDSQLQWASGISNAQGTQNFGDLVLSARDIQAPSVPTNLSASAITFNSLTLNWSASTDNIGVSGYDIYSNAIKINSAPVTTTTYQVTNLSASTTYHFYVQARDVAGNISGNSNTLVVTTLAQAGCPNTGAIAFQRWNNISGTSIANLTSNAAYPNTPSLTGTLSSFEIPTDAGDNYGIRVNGYICPPLTGAYTFWVSGDDETELWLSTNSNIANKVRIAYHNSWTLPREWNRVSSQKSTPVTLTAGQLYYVEALMKEGAGGDNLAVGWAKPGQSTVAPAEIIPGNSLVFQLTDLEAPTAPTNLAASSITQSGLTLTWTSSSDDIAVTGYDVFQNNIKINAANVTTNSYNVSGLSASTPYSFYVTAKDAAGNVTPGNSITATTTPVDTEVPTPPTNLSAANIGGSSCTIFWNASSDNVGVAGYDIFRDGEKVNSSPVNTTSYVLTGLTPGSTYSVYVIAVDLAGNVSAASIPLSITTLLPATGTESFTQRTIIANQRMPHDLVYGPDNNIWYIERYAGTVSFVNPVTGIKTMVLSLGARMVLFGSQDGLMGLALHPEFANGKPFVYISYTYASTGPAVRITRIERYTYNSALQILEQPVTVLENIPGSNDHNSGRIAIGPDLKLYYTVGDMGAGQFNNINRPNNAQNLDILEGKILRLNTEALNNSWIPSDNPFSAAGAKTPVYTLGHRNAQGLVWGTVNGSPVLYSSEHGPYSDDEINIILPGRNYGWPKVMGFCDGNYNGRTVGGFTVVSEQDNCAELNVMEPMRSLFPATVPPTDETNNATWPSTAPSGTEFYGSTAIPGWQNSLLVAQLKAGTISRFKLSTDGLSIISDTINYFRGLGRFRDVVVSPDGLKIYVACDSSGATSGPTGNSTSTPANPGSILEFTYQPPARLVTQLIKAMGLTSATGEVKKSISIYPNPARDFIIVYDHLSLTRKNVALFDVAGKLVKRQIITNAVTKISTANFAAGLYFFEVRDINNNLLTLEKIVLEK